MAKKEDREKHIARRMQMAITNSESSDYSTFGRSGWETLKQSFYDSAAYPAAGLTPIMFFQTSQGQGTGLAGGTKTISDSNLVGNGGAFPSGQEYLVQSIEVLFFPSTPTPGTAGQLPVAYGVAPTAAATAGALVNDEYIFRRSGNLKFVVGSKDWLIDGPMQRFPGKTNYSVTGAASDSTTAAATQAFRAVKGNCTGRPYTLSPADIKIESTVNYSVSLNWPEGVQAIINPAWIKVILDGFWFRRTQ